MKIIFPWLNNTDWTYNIYSAMDFIYREDFVFIDKNIDFSSGNFLINKTKTTYEVISRGILNDCETALFIDSSLIDFRSIRMYYPECKLIGLVNGGEFQKYGFSHQLDPEEYNKALHYENSLLSYLDKIVLPSKFAMRQFTEMHNDLKEKITYAYLPLGNLPENKNIYSSMNKSGVCFCGRHTFDKGYDIICEILQRGIDIDIIHGEKKNFYYDRLSSYRYVVFPSREELFGYGVVECIFLGVIPILPMDLSYREITILPYYIEDLSVSSIVSAIKYYDCLSEVKRKEIIEKNQNHLVKLCTNNTSLINIIGKYL